MFEPMEVNDNDMKQHRKFCICSKAEGNHFLVYGSPLSRKFPLHCLLGPDWFCSMVTITLIATPTLWLLIVGHYYFSVVVNGAYTVSAFTVLSSFMITGFSDPGIIKKQSREELEMLIENGDFPRNGVLCDKCNIYRPSDAHHCFECNVCIRGHDHHCPWTGKCIGERNLKFFYIFLASLCFHMLATFIYFQIYVMRRTL